MKRRGHGHRYAPRPAPGARCPVGQRRRGNPGGECAELALLPRGSIAIRNSCDPDGFWLFSGVPAVRALIEAAKAGEFDHLVNETP